jgi:Uma2 family endonuclease
LKYTPILRRHDSPGTVVSSYKSVTHGIRRFSGTLHGLIWTWLQSHPGGRLFHAPYDIVLSEFDVVEPDLVYFSSERAAQVLTPLHARGVPELVIEIASKGTRKRDETTKRRLYEQVGISEYWVVDPEVDVLRVYRRGDASFGRPIELSREAGDVLTTPLLQGLSLPLARIFRD